MANVGVSTRSLQKSHAFLSPLLLFSPFFRWKNRDLCQLSMKFICAPVACTTARGKPALEYNADYRVLVLMPMPTGPTICHWQ